MTQPRVALVFPATIAKRSFFGFVLPSLGLERLGAVIEDTATVELFDARFERDLVGEIVRFQPDWVAISVKTTMTSPMSYELARQLRRLSPSSRLVMGGLHATSCPEEALEVADYVIRGDGETAFQQLIAGVSPDSIEGLSYKEDQVVHSNPLAEPLLNLDALPPPARHLRKAHYRYMAAGLIPMDLLETSRGCTHACSFCSPGSVYPCQYRTHSPSYLMEEIRSLAQRGVKYCMLTDDHFGGDDERVEALCDAIIESGIRIAFFAFIRPFSGKMNLKRKMVAAGFVFFSYGAESPAPEQLRRYGKGYPAAEDFIARVNAEWLAAGALYIGNSYVFGDVKDTRETLASLGVYARRLGPTFIEPLYSQPYPGTRYREELAREHRLRDRPWSDFTESRLLVEHPEIADDDEMRRLRAKMWLDFFSPRKAAYVFRGPLYFHRHLGLPVLTVLRYMHACDYVVFGCLLEHKPYEDLQVELVHDWFFDHLPSFEPEEMELDDLCPVFDDFTNMIGLRWFKRCCGGRDLVVKVYAGADVVASLVVTLADGAIVGTKVFAADRNGQGRSWSIALPLALLARFLGSTARLTKAAMFCLMTFNVMCFDLPRRVLAYLRGAKARRAGS